jgi:3-dehydroquinate synthase
MTHVIPIPIPGRAYDIVIGAGILAGGSAPSLAPVVAGCHCHIVSDSHVAPLYLAPLQRVLHAAGAARVSESVFAAGETSKHHQTLLDLYADAVAAGVDRKSLIIALGGGVVGDVAGFLAASYMRGIPFVQVATSLVAQVDSSIGGKTGVDLPSGKNLVGAFHQPQHVLIDVDVLQTLPPRQLRCGLAEVVKYGVILDAEFFGYLEDHVPALLAPDPAVSMQIVRRSCELKAQVVLEDEFDMGLRAILNYGHTFGHALEKVTGYAALTHGEAIAVGMCMAADLVSETAPSPAMTELVKRQDGLFTALGLPCAASGVVPADVLAAMRSDKKYVGGSSRLVLPDRLGRVAVVPDVPDGDVLAAISGRIRGEQTDGS